MSGPTPEAAGAGRRGADWVVAIFGATGAVGRIMIERLEASAIGVRELRLLASPRSAGQALPFRGRALAVEPVRAEAFDGVDVALFSAGGEASGTWAPIACERGAAVVDNSSRWRMDPAVPLIVPEVNRHALAARRTVTERGVRGALIANPNCSTIQLVVALSPLRRRFGLRRVFVATYQSASGRGQTGLAALADERRTGTPAQNGAFPAQLLGNVLPQVDHLLEDGWSREEEKTLLETRKILDLPDLWVHTTCARVPVDVGHSEAVYLECECEVDPAAARAALRAGDGVMLVEEDAVPPWPTALSTAGTDPVWVGRVRADRSDRRGLHLWIVADNLRKGAATNAVQIVECWWAAEVVR